MLSWQKSKLLPIAVPFGDSTVYTEARLAFRTDENGNIGLAVHSLRKEPQLDFPYMGHKFSAEEEETLLATGNLGKTIEFPPRTEKPSRLTSPSTLRRTKYLSCVRTDIPKEISFVHIWSDAAIVQRI